MNLELKRNKFNIVIGHNYVKNYSENLYKLDELGIKYASILHDMDTDKDGTLKNPHYHLILKCKDRIRASTILNRLAEIFNCDTINIQIDECYNYIASIQYLLHVNNADKFQYDFCEIKSNIDVEILESYFKSKIDIELTADLLIQYVDSGMTKRQLMRQIGLSKFNTYYKTIEYLYNSVKDLT